MRRNYYCEKDCVNLASNDSPLRMHMHRNRGMGVMQPLT